MGGDFQLEEALVRVVRNIKRCDTIITELLDYARVKSHQPRATVLDTWLTAVLREHPIPESITLNCDLQTDGAIVDIDLEKLRRAIVNVVDNACQAMTDGTCNKSGTPEGELTIATRKQGEQIEIEISDTGSGIPRDILPQVLEPLFSTKSFGTGLGLPIVHQIIERHGGRLEISSEEGRGTQVLLWLQMGNPCRLAGQT
jgi:signal transduction histidine kinase